MSPRCRWMLSWPAISVLVVTVAGVLIGHTAIGRTAPSDSRNLMVLYTSQAYGQIRSCNCTKFRYGGYGREATLVEKLKKENPNIIIIEGGDAIGQNEGAQDKLKSDVAMRSLDAIGYAVFALGDAELRLDRKTMQEWKGKYKTPMVVANVKHDDGEPLTDEPYVIRKMPNGLRVAVIGVIGPGILSNSAKVGISSQISDPKEALKGLLPKIRPQADYVIVSAHTDKNEAREIAGIDGIDLVLCTHSFEKLVMPEEGKNIVQSTTEMVGDCALVVTGSRSGWSAGRLDVEIAGKTAKIAQNRTFFLDRAYDEHPTILKLYDEYNTKVAETTMAQQNEMKEKFENLMKQRGIDPSKRQRPKVYAGVSSCKMCHEDAYKVWEKGRHAGAFATLRKMGQEADPECIRCHTTGAMQRGGFVNHKDTPELINVQCESCHGAGASHAEKPAPGYGAVSEELCRSCHTEAYNPDFDFEEMTRRIEHKKKE